MNLSVFSENNWIYPDTCHTLCKEIKLEAARNSYIGFQILGDILDCPSKISLDISWNKPGLTTTFYQLLDIGVDENTDSEFMTTTDYSRCKSFVTREAPFRVYDGLKPFTQNSKLSDRFGLYVELYIPKKEEPGCYQGELAVTINNEIITIFIECNVYQASVPALNDSRLGVMDFFSFDNISVQHNVTMYSDAYWDLYRIYVKSQLNMRCTHIMLPNANPIYNEHKQIIDFDFTHVIKASTIALEEGSPYIVGAAIAHWGEWNDKNYYLLWDKEVAAESLDGYFQLKTYFIKWALIVKEKQWERKLLQSLADEPQVHNDVSYRAISSIFRRFLPGIPIIEAVETFNLGGGVDIWVPKQDTYEKHKEIFEQIKAAGETMWFYTCAFPAGKIMNRSMDLPLLVSRYILWMGFSYNLEGFLHWGFNFYEGSDIFNYSCCPHKGKKLPAGDAHIVYPGGNSVYTSMRYLQQRAGAQDYELFRQLEKTDSSSAHKIVKQVCRSFHDYTIDEDIFLHAHQALLKAFDINND